MKHILLFSKIGIYLTLTLFPAAWVAALYFDFFYSIIPGLNISFIRLMYYISWGSLLFVMVIRPLGEIFPQYRFLKQLIFLRKALGILSATIIVCNLAGTAFTQVGFWGNYFALAKWSFGYPIIARISEITAIILLATSNMWSMKKFGKNWKNIQRLSYPYFISGGLIAAQYEPNFYYTSMSVVIFIYLVNIIQKYLRK